MNDDKLATCFGYTVYAFILIAVGTLLNGWALSTIWNWFIPPVFGITTLTMWQAVGVSMVFSLFNGTKTQSSNSNGSKTSREVFIESAVTVVLTPVLSVFMAWIVLQFAF